MPRRTWVTPNRVPESPFCSTPYCAGRRSVARHYAGRHFATRHDMELSSSSWVGTPLYGLLRTSSDFNVRRNTVTHVTALQRMSSGCNSRHNTSTQVMDWGLRIVLESLRKEQESKAGFGKFTIRPIYVNSLGWTGSIRRVDGFRKLRVLPICENSLDRASSVEDDIGKLTVRGICHKSIAKADTIRGDLGYLIKNSLNFNTCTNSGKEPTVVISVQQIINWQLVVIMILSESGTSYIIIKNEFLEDVVKVLEIEKRHSVPSRMNMTCNQSDDLMRDKYNFNTLPAQTVEDHERGKFIINMTDLWNKLEAKDIEQVEALNAFLNQHKELYH
ncbi:hypothetical protein HZH66_002615 [Vespula vulgaris]|uniref:Uncharacterized protein n=1 Tax=Vespula vulgaris TaxID=7454 RepID=A0A834NHX5_VESVU|nr:hypothetical protein HZH66_002615 [Vespula vulgaris]